MERKELIAKCRYYKGEEQDPFEGNEGMFWFYEECWVRMELESMKIGKPTGTIETSMEDYLWLGLEDFSKDDNVPITLKAILFNRYCKTSYCMRDSVDDFKKFYKKEYLKEREDDNKNNK